MEAFCGLLMALADSVPGVSGGTVAFLMGIYDRLIASLHGIFSRNRAVRGDSLGFLLRLGWAAGMAGAMLLLANFLEAHICEVTSLFLGFVLASVPAVAWKERGVLAANPRAAMMLPVGAAAVLCATIFGAQSAFEQNLAHLSLVNGPVLFVAAAAAAAAMILPGISGSSLLMAFGLYAPLVRLLSGLLHGDFSGAAAVAVFGLGALTGLMAFLRLLRAALARHRAATIYAALGMMFASLYGIALGPISLGGAASALSAQGFRPVFFLLGCALIGLMARLERRAVPHGNADKQIEKNGSESI